ncbi:Serine/threonine-protein kinase pkn1 [Novipirellula aureliae]|uniref:Serine/threonine-protein kinase pkn1 n=1 Tax=Novipirellula aureliae TaxID=2527966 RepID=A0A5C6DIF8_9BACT|nr:SUMF1/EgtB/PvdO family nonheme iron enzyme [Novipirellula aureliae]TWU36488.1 Serine/threonine-protein kinase pkn1 [Novipirellula aureliae]
MKFPVRASLWFACVVTFLPWFSSSGAVFAESVEGRFVTITLPGNSRTLSVAEVQVFSGEKNVALGKETKQTSTAHGGVSARAVDGDTNGNWTSGSVTHTVNDLPTPSWEVDLGELVEIEKITIWNRDGFESRLKDVQTLVLDSDRKVVWGAVVRSPQTGQTVLDVAETKSAVKVGRKVAKLKESKNAKAARPTSREPAVPLPEENGGVLNGPLMKGGHHASGEGDRESLRLAIEDLINTYGDKYAKGEEFLSRLDAMDNEKSEEFAALKKEALLANPLLDFDHLLMVRSKKGKRFSANWQTRVSCGPAGGFDDELVVMSPICDGEIKTVYKPDGGKFVGDVDLHFDGDRLLFASHCDINELSAAPGKGMGYAVFEQKIDPRSGEPLGKPQRVTPDMGADIDCYDACYLPDERIIFASTASYEGVPCVGGKSYVANLYRMNPDGTGVRRLTFDQDASWHPAMMESGRVMYARWEYTDSAHYFSRVLMTMNPDGTDQKAFYGSNSYWPNSIFFARQIPGHNTKFLATVTGHHSNPKGGALCLFDVSKGRQEADGAVQLITGRGKEVEPLVIDNLSKVYSPMFYTPYPLSDKYFLAMTGNSVYLLDVFDNMLCLKKMDGEGGYFEPLPLRATKRPPIMPDRINLESQEATVLINDIYEGPGLQDVPRGTVKGLRVYRYEYGPRHKGGHYSMAMEAGWDAKQVLGTAPVEADGSASFTVPANTPFAMQPLDEQGKSLQLMRSWTVAMPGERLSCVGCHESQNMPPVQRRATAMLRAPSELESFYGSTRGFSFQREVQPVLDTYCVSCHDGSHNMTPDGHDKAGRYQVADRIIGTGPNTGRKFAEAGIPDLSNAKAAHAMLHPYVRRNGPEGDYHLLTPLEFHADTSELVQMLQKGHHNVELDQEAWERLITWIDLNAPYHGTWSEAGANATVLERRKELRRMYDLVSYDPEEILNPYEKAKKIVLPKPLERDVVQPRPSRVGAHQQKTLDFELGDGVTMKLVSVPSGEFSMGSNDETPVEQPISRVAISEPFFIGATEVSLEQFRQFDPEYLNGVYDMHYKDQVKRGYYMNHMQYPVIRVSWDKAKAFCDWLSEKTGRKVTLPTEAQWEWACRAGTDTPLSFGDLDTDFSKHANLSDISVQQMAVKGVDPKPMSNPNHTVDFKLQDPRSDDGTLHLAKVGSFEPNAWGVFDMHGNAAEWTRSDYVAYPYSEGDGRINDSGEKVLRGGSWHDRPFRATSSYRLGYPAWQRVYHAGFRVVVE